MLLFQRYSKILVGGEVGIFQKKSILQVPQNNLQHFLTRRQDFYVSEFNFQVEEKEVGAYLLWMEWKKVSWAL